MKKLAKDANNSREENTDEDKKQAEQKIAVESEISTFDKEQEPEAIVSNATPAEPQPAAVWYDDAVSSKQDEAEEQDEDKEGTPIF